jgi:hypothetical protein
MRTDLGLQLGKVGKASPCFLLPCCKALSTAQKNLGLSFQLVKLHFSPTRRVIGNHLMVPSARGGRRDAASLRVFFKLIVSKRQREIPVFM